MRIALAQISPVSAEPGPPTLEKPHSTTPFPSIDVNLQVISREVTKAKEGGAEVVVFPEYFVQGIVNERRQYLTYPSDHILHAIQSLAKSNNICIVGSIVTGKLPSETPEGISFPFESPFAIEDQPSTSGSRPKGNKISPGQLAWAKFLETHHSTVEEDAEPVLRNTAVFIDNQGEIVGSYVKRNLWHPEREYLTPGEEEHKVFDTPFGKAGLMICWDMSHPAAAQQLADLGADIIFAPTYWLATDSEPLIHNHPHQPSYESDIVSSLCMIRSFETETIWIMCNAGGDDLEGFMGGSGVWAPLRGCIKKMNNLAGMEFVDVDLDVLKDARQTYKIREDWSRKEAS